MDRRISEETKKYLKDLDADGLSSGVSGEYTYFDIDAIDASICNDVVENECIRWKYETDEWERMGIIQE